jgi:putative ABC transport system permease protein
VLGALGAVAGVAGGLVLAALARPLLEDRAQEAFGHFDVRPAEVAAISLFGLLTGLLAAVLPARTAARQDPVAALAGRRPNAPTSRHVPAIGVVLAAGGAGLAALGSALALGLATGETGKSTLAAALIGGGAALAQIGLIVCSPALALYVAALDD